MIGYLPKNKNDIKHWSTHVGNVTNNALSAGYVYIKNTPTITIKELSRIISESRKHMIKIAHGQGDINAMECCFKELRDRLELRRRARV
jgi:hypothetical protein